MQEKQEINVIGTNLQWDRTNGSFQFEGADVVLFWTKTALKTFIDTIEEVTGTEPARIVMETAGYRTGKIVSGFYKEIGEETEDVLALLPNIYAAAGWGAIEFKQLCLTERRAILSIRNDWESKVVRAQGKESPGTFLGGHWAGLLSGLLEETIWYKVTEYTSTDEGSYKEIELYPSPMTPSENVREHIQTQEQQTITQLEAMVENRTIELRKMIRELSSPVIPVLDGILVTPVMGRFDQERSDDFTEKALQAIVEHKASMLILDVTGIKAMNNLILSTLEKVTQSVQLIGAVPIIAGISPELGMEMASKGIYLNNLKCFATLKHAIHYAIALEGIQIVKKEDK
ncbi:STAS domain-containing protein [Domibacillus sp. A3M-37]|uniref:STAS domain-containing protein n=1 Tax=Domibacillus TaxID=1433999 RepID=UPI0020B7CE72|nr:STAS domain-containing protein [Domibacillus sp. A3M-37]MCP3762235.1 STAS domain-containing protein [Domibacillus sp. A3M-37]